MSMVNTKRRRGSPTNSIIPPGPSRLRRPHIACPISGGGAELEEGGRDLKRERDAGEGVCHVGWAWAGWNNNGGGFVVEEGGS